MVLIGLMGGKGSGKTTGAAYLVNNYNYCKKSFAGCLKKACQCLFMLTREQLYGEQEDKENSDPRWFNCSARKIVKFIGTDLLRDNMHRLIPELGKDIFVHRFTLWYEEKIKNDPEINVVVDDVRFENENECIKKFGGIIIKIERSSSDGQDMHPSETELNNLPYDFLIENNGTKEELHMTLNHCLSKY